MMPPDVAGLAAPGTVGIAGIDDPLRVVADAADFARTQTAYPPAGDLVGVDAGTGEIS